MTRKIQNLKGCSSNKAAVVICWVVLFLAAFVIISAGTSLATVFLLCKIMWNKLSYITFCHLFLTDSKSDLIFYCTAKDVPNLVNARWLWWISCGLEIVWMNNMVHCNVLFRGQCKNIVRASDLLWIHVPPWTLAGVVCRVHTESWILKKVLKLILHSNFPNLEKSGK